MCFVIFQKDYMYLRPTLLMVLIHKIIPETLVAQQAEIKVLTLN